MDKSRLISTNLDKYQCLTWIWLLNFWCIGFFCYNVTKPNHVQAKTSAFHWNILIKICPICLTWLHHSNSWYFLINPSIHYCTIIQTLDMWTLSIQGEGGLVGSCWWCDSSRLIATFPPSLSYLFTSPSERYIVEPCYCWVWEWSYSFIQFVEQGSFACFGLAEPHLLCCNTFSLSSSVTFALSPSSPHPAPPHPPPPLISSPTPFSLLLLSRISPTLAVLPLHISTRLGPSCLMREGRACRVD